MKSLAVLLYLLVGISYSTSYYDSRTERGYQKPESHIKTLAIVTWPIWLTVELTTFLVNSNYPKVQR